MASQNPVCFQRNTVRSCTLISALTDPKKTSYCGRWHVHVAWRCCLSLAESFPEQAPAARLPFCAPLRLESSPKNMSVNFFLHCLIQVLNAYHLLFSSFQQPSTHVSHPHTHVLFLTVLGNRIQPYLTITWPKSASMRSLYN